MILDLGDQYMEIVHNNVKKYLQCGNAYFDDEYTYIFP